MTRERFTFRDLFDNPILVGTVTLLVVLVAVYLSYIAENGFPFTPVYDVNIQVADAGELTKNADVRIGGARVGQVLKIIPEPAERGYPHPYAKLAIQLDKSLGPLATDTRYQVRLASPLGGQYVEIIPGHDRAHTVPDGGTLPISQNIPYVDLNQAFDVFGPKTQSGLRSVATSLGDAFAGRGAQLNQAIQSTANLLGPLQQLLRVLGAPSTDLSGFVSGLDSTTAALAPVMPALVRVLQNSATTFRALDTPALGATIDALPSTESLGTTVLTNNLPVLREAASIARALEPAARYLPTAARRVDEVLAAAPPTFKLVGPVAGELNQAIAAASALARDPNAAGTLKLLGTNDLGTTGASAFFGLGAILDTIAPAQLACNVGGLWVRNLASALSEGDASGNWLRFMPLVDSTQVFQSGQLAADLHSVLYPVENSSQCQAGNESYSVQQTIGDPGYTGNKVDDTAPPSGVLAEGQKAGLVP